MAPSRRSDLLPGFPVIQETHFGYALILNPAVLAVVQPSIVLISDTSDSGLAKWSYSRTAESKVAVRHAD